MTDFKKIKVIIIDCDGTMTDGIYQVNNKGIVTKSFYTRDLYGIEQMLKNDIKVVIMSQSTDNCIYKKLKSIRKTSRSNIWQDAFKKKKIILLRGVDDKRKKIEDVILSFSSVSNMYESIYFLCNWNNLAYMGDAENDLECMQKALYTGCPNDAVTIIKEESNYLCDTNGGYGAVYEFCMHILNKIKEQENANNETQYRR